MALNNKSKILAGAIWLMLLTSLSGMIFSQSDSVNYPGKMYWVTLTGGFSGLPPVKGYQYFTASASFTIQNKKPVFYLAHLTLGSDIDSGFGEAGIEYGRSSKGYSSYYAISAGPAAINFGKGSPKIGVTVGLGISGQLFLRGKSLGMGINCHANINSFNSFFSVGIGLQIGRLRGKEP